MLLRTCLCNVREICAGIGTFSKPLFGQEHFKGTLCTLFRCARDVPEFVRDFWVWKYSLVTAAIRRIQYEFVNLFGMV